MALARINTNWQNGSYEQDRNALIMPAENTLLYNNDGGQGVYEDGLSLAIGFGHDILYGGEGNDTINGGDGNNHIYGGTGNDILSVGEGYDIYYFNRGDGQDMGACEV